MSHTHSNKPEPRRKPWFSGLTLATIGLAWAWIGAWGWFQSVALIVAPVLVVLTGGAQILAARMMVLSANASPARRSVMIALAVACAAWSGFSGKRGVELAQAAPIAAYEAAEARLIAIEAAMVAIPPAPLVDAAGRSLGPQRLAMVLADRDAAMARLVADREAALAAMPETRPSTPIPPAMLWLVAGLVEALGLFGLWALTDRRSQPTASLSAIEAGQTLARLRWGQKRQA
jgi:hypothetical protein